MKILVVGSGGREHALVWKLSREAEVVAAPGNPGIAEICPCHDVAVMDLDTLVALAEGLGVDLVVVGPEDPLIFGIADKLRKIGIATFGPGMDGAQLEGSKVFSKELMKEAGVPTAMFGSFTDAAAAHQFAALLFEAGRGVVVKASGAALGKGVTVCSTFAEAERSIDFALVDRGFGAAGTEIVVEERLNGREFSLLTLCSDGEYKSLPVAQDYKRIYDGDRGPNTGGMGSYSPVPWISDDLLRRTEREIVEPTLKALKDRGISYRGVLFSGVMVVDEKPYCLEYNVRFGDPETQSVMARIGGGFAAALMACAKGEPIPEFEVLDNAVVSVVVASGGYPGAVLKGVPVAIGQMHPGVTVFQAGLAREDGKYVTNGGRVLAVTATSATVNGARTLAYEGVKSVCFEEMQFRTDIAARV